MAAKKLKTVNGLNQFSTEKVKDMSYMFTYCSNLESVDLTSFKATNVTDMDAMFAYCDKLKTIQLPVDFKVQMNTGKAGIFNGCDSLPNEIKKRFNA